MKARRRFLLAIVAVATVGGLIWLVLRESEPNYEGKSLSAWLEEARQRHERGDILADTRIETRSPNAIRAMGPKSLPMLVTMVGKRESALRAALALAGGGDQNHRRWLGSFRGDT